MVRVLFVCLGNICRSPMAEAVFSHRVRQAGLEDQIEADSAGTGHWHVGETPHAGTRKILDRERIHYEGRARLLTKEDLNRFDIIAVMDRENLRNVRALGTGRAKIVLFMSCSRLVGVDEVPDPYYNGQFDVVYELVSIAADGLLESIRKEFKL